MFEVNNEMVIDVTGLTIDEQLEACRLLVKAGYIVERQYRVKDDKGRVKTKIIIGKRCG